MEFETNEFIDDRAIEEHGHDRLGHRIIAGQLIVLMKSVRTPANIALYGRWGAGKTSLANLLGKTAESDPDIVFLRFDAFKWAELPLRRHFISHVARALKVNDTKFHRGLYEHEETIEVSFPTAKSLLFVGGALALLLFLTVMIGWFLSYQDGSSTTAMIRKIVDVIGIATLLALVTGPVAFFAGKTIPMKRTSLAPSSSEQFENLFSELVHELRANQRLVVFVDELDRCSPTEVVGTLETLKTFLGIERSVFIVAADRGVLELALSQRARQSTPADAENPYYSSGSEYLDKVFHYQVVLPPLLPQRLSAFAADLVRDRGGVWEEVDIDRVIPVLIPSHVRSPRRVKALLNNFVISYRVALERGVAGAIDAEVKARAPELAKLVALRMEFPLFARHLELDDRLCEWIPRYLKDAAASFPATMSAKVRALVAQYANAERQVAPILSERNSEDLDLGELATESDEGEEADELRRTDSGNGEHDSSISEAGEADGKARETHRSLGRQLTSYLQKTRSVTGPRRDLIFLETPGFAFGLEPSFADGLEEVAIDGNLPELEAMFVRLSDSQKLATIRMLATKSRYASGIESENALRGVLVLLAGLDENAMAEVGDEVMESVRFSLGTFELAPSELVGALRLHLNSRGAGGTAVAELLANEATMNSPEVALMVLESYSRLRGGHEARLAEVFSHWLVDETLFDKAWPVLVGLKAEERQQLLEACEPALRRELRTIESSEEGEANALLSHALKNLLSSGLDWEVEILLRIALSLKLDNLVDEVYKHFGAVTEILDPELASVVIEVVARRQFKEWQRWLGPLVGRTSALAVSDESIGLLVSPIVAVLGKDWNQLNVREALEVAASLVEERPLQERKEGSEILATALGRLTVPAPTPREDAEILAQSEEICASGLADLSSMVEPVCLRLQHYLGQSLEAGPGTKGPREFVNRWGRWIGNHGGGSSVRDLIARIEACTWLPTPERAALRCAMASSAILREEGVEFPYAQEELVALVEANRDRPSRKAISEAVASWLEALRPTAGEAAPLVRRFARNGSPSLFEALSRYSSTLQSKDRKALLWPVVERHLSQPVSGRFLKALGFGMLDEEDVVGLCVDLYASASRNSEREKVLDLLTYAHLESSSARRRAFEEIIIPAVGENKGSLGAVLSRMDLLEDPPYGVKKKLELALVESLRGNRKVYKRYHEELEDLGVIPVRGFLRRLLS